MTKLIDNSEIPEIVTHVTETLETAGFEAFVVGGCVRDLLMGRKPKDWDITTNATPDEIIDLFPKTVYENDFGTVAVIFETETSNIQIEVTPYRLEGGYSDFRHPDTVSFSQNIDDDLKRRDFTINAMAYSPSKGQLIDIYKGQSDIKDKLIRTVGSPSERFNEDALRLLRAVRFSTELDFVIEKETEKSILENSHLLKNISIERVRDEFNKIMMSESPMRGIKLLKKYEILKYILPELEEGIGCEQKGEHVFDVYEHLLHALEHSAEKDWSLDIRFSALLHDIGKPRTRRYDRTKDKFTFYGHEVVGEKMVDKILSRLKMPHKFSEKVIKLVRNHMFFSDPEKITLSAVRRLVKNVGPENIWDLMKVRECDRVGMKKKEAPYRLRKYHSMIEEALRSPTSVGMLKIDGKKIMEITGENPGPKIGYILHALLEEALENPDINTEEVLASKSKELAKLSLDDLKKLGEAGKIKKEEEEAKELEEIRKRYGVK